MIWSVVLLYIPIATFLHYYARNWHFCTTFSFIINFQRLFQDTVYDFEKAYRKNPVGGDKVTNERKLAILEKALSSNPASEQLLEEKLTICERIWPADQLANECTRALAQDPGNLMLWRSLVHTTRNSMARCTVPGVQQLYTKAMSRINQLRLHRAAIRVEQDILSQ